VTRNARPYSRRNFLVVYSDPFAFYRPGVFKLIPNSAFITVGESARSVEGALAGRAPRAEYLSLREGHFTELHAMIDQVQDPGSISAGARFAFNVYRATWRRENIYLGEEFPGIQYLAVHALLGAFAPKKRIAMLIHNVSSRKRALPLATLRLATLVDQFLCLSNRSKGELVDSYGVPASRVTVVGSRVDTDFFQPRAEVLVKAQVCSAGAINRDYKTLIEAVQPLNVPLKIAADTAWQYSAMRNEAPITVPQSVEMRSWGNYVNLRSLYAESAVVVVPLLKPMLSGVTVALEAMAMGKPLIMTRNPYVEDFLIDGKTGFFVPAKDPAALREKIAYLLANQREATQMGARARELAVERFSVERYVNSILSVWS
jgi:glycosyltransferase involved in cell wall biosynthesis